MSNVVFVACYISTLHKLQIRIRPPPFHAFRDFISFLQILLWPMLSVHACAVQAQHPLLAPSEQRGSGWWLQPAGSRRTARAELSATPVLH